MTICLFVSDVNDNYVIFKLKYFTLIPPKRDSLLSKVENLVNTGFQLE